MGMTIKSSRKWLDFAFNDPSSLRLWPRCLDGDWSDLSALRAETLSSLGRLGARSGDTGRCRGHPLSSPVSDARCDVTLGPRVTICELMRQISWFLMIFINDKIPLNSKCFFWEQQCQTDMTVSYPILEWRMSQKQYKCQPADSVCVKYNWGSHVILALTSNVLHD